MSGPNRGRVVIHASQVLVDEAVGKVSQAGRARVLREKRKNVHAGIAGELVSISPQIFEGDRITYNPYKFECFVLAESEEPYRNSASAYLNELGKVYVS